MIDTRTLRQALVVFRKELKDSVRDRRALVSIAFGVLIGPVLIAFIMNGVAERQREAESVEIPVVGQEHAPAFVDWLRQQAGVQIVAGPEEPETAVREREQDVVLVITPEFAERFRTSRPAVVKVVSDSSRNAARPTVERVRRLVQRYSTEIGSLRLIGRGVSPAAMAPLQLQDVEVSTAQQRAAEVLAFIPMFIIMAAFVGGMQIATDTTAGERERGSLEPLLVNPAPRAAFVTGKWLAAAAAAMASVVLTTLVCASLPRLLPLQDMGIRFRFGPEHVGGVMAAVLPMCLFTASLQTSVATMARSFKEAQTYMGILVILPMIPGMMSLVYPLGSAAWMYVVPLLGPHVLLTDVMGERTPQASAFVAAGLVSLTAAAMLVALTTRLFRSERIIFAR